MTQRRGGLRRGRIKPMSDKRAALLDDRREIREAVFARDRWCCQWPDRHDCWGGLTPHHRRKDSQGGAYSMENLVTLCAVINGRIEADPEIARRAHEIGFVLRAGD